MSVKHKPRGASNVGGKLSSIQPHRHRLNQTHCTKVSAQSPCHRCAQQTPLPRILVFFLDSLWAVLKNAAPLVLFEVNFPDPRVPVNLPTLHCL